MMNNIAFPEDVNSYGNKDYWETRFESEEQYDWLCSYTSYKNILESTLNPDDKILILGCGNSTLSSDLYRSGFTRITNIDYSDNVIQKMKKKYKDCVEMEWITMDILDMKFEPGVFDVVIEKATLDTFLVSETDPWNISANSQSTMNIILQQVADALKKDGRFISITWVQPHFRKILLAKSEYQWSIQTQTFGTEFHFFIHIMKWGQLLSENDFSIYQKAQNMPGLAGTLETLLEDDSEDFLNKIIV